MNSGAVVQEMHSEQVHFPGYSIIKQNTLIYQATVNTFLSIYKGYKERHFLRN